MSANSVYNITAKTFCQQIYDKILKYFNKFFSANSNYPFIRNLAKTNYDKLAVLQIFANEKNLQIKLKFNLQAFSFKCIINNIINKLL